MKPFQVWTAIYCTLGLPIATVAKDIAEPEEEFAAFRDMLARNQEALHRFCWNMHTEISVGGQVLKINDHLCRYGPDGTVYKTPMDARPGQNDVRGLRRRAVEIKRDEIQDSMEAAVALVYDYAHLSPQKLDALSQTENALFVKRAGSERTVLQLRDYVKPGDFLVLSFDPATKSLRTMDVISYLAEQADAVTLHVLFESLSDGTTYVASSVLNATATQMQVKTENGNYRRLWQ